MRPVEKLTAGTIITTVYGSHTVQASYNPHTNALVPLVSSLGGYCSYCEVASTDLEVEHVISQNQNTALKHDWDNFLLACGKCNGKGNKSSKAVNFPDLYFPHKNNTLMAFEYVAGGVIKPHSSLNAQQQTRAVDTINLLGLDKYPGNPTGANFNQNDLRWLSRQEAWDQANKYLPKYQTNKDLISSIWRWLKGIFLYGTRCFSGNLQ